MWTPTALESSTAGIRPTPSDAGGPAAPVLPILAFDDEEEAIARAQQHPIRATRFINGQSLFTVDLDAPFGGTLRGGS